MADWDDFLWPADQWFVAYATAPPAPAVTLFAIGHTVELYLKAAFMKQTGDEQQAMAFNHKIKRLWDTLKANDPAFMPSYELRDVVYNSDFAKFHGKNLSHDTWMHFIKNQELYWIAKHLADLKYIGVRLKTIEHPGWLGMEHPNDYWIAFLKELRGYLQYPGPHHGDGIRQFLKHPYNSSVLNNGFLYLLSMYPEATQLQILQEKERLRMELSKPTSDELLL